MSSRRSITVCAALMLILCSCAGADTAADGEAGGHSDLASEFDLEMLMGTESGNPSEEATETEIDLGTESGNPVDSDVPTTDDVVDEQLGTESGNPTRPPPVVEDAPIDVAPRPENTAPSAGHPDSPVDADPGSTATPPPTSGSPNEPELSCDPSTCEAAAGALASSLSQVGPSPESFDDALCDASGSCECRGATRTVTLQLQETGCLVTGRRGCLYSAEEFAGCDVAVPDSCMVACDTVLVREQADAEGAPYVVRASACTSLGCRFVLTDDEHCLLGTDSGTVSDVDCDASDGVLHNAP